jgi:TonB family protein
MLTQFTKTIRIAGLIVGLSAMAAQAASAEETTRKVIQRVAPLFPPVAQKANLTGTVKIELTILPNGTVKTVKTVGGNALFVEAAEAAVKKWKFEPGPSETTELIAVKFDPIRPVRNQ